MRVESFWKADLLCSQRCVQRQDVDAAGLCVCLLYTEAVCTVVSQLYVPRQSHLLAHAFLHRRHLSALSEIM